MKIGIDISQIVYQTGVSRYTAELVSHLIDLAPQHHYFLYGGSLRQKNTLRSFISQLKTTKVTSKITNLSPKFADLLWNRLSLFDPTTNQDLDLFHASNWALPGVSTKLVTTIHDLSFIKYPKIHTQKSIKVHTRHLNKSKKRADLVITDANSTKKDLIKYGFNPGKIKVIPLATSSIFKPETNQEKIKKTLDKYNLKTPFILSVGSLNPRKNLKRLIKAYTNLKISKNSPQLVLAGSFGWGERVKPVNGVRLLGFVSDQDLVNLYSIAKVFVYPSLYEGFGFPVLEAMACGCPVITSKVSSLPEVGGEAAIYINPKSVKEISLAINRVLQFDDLNHRTTVKAGIDQAKKFSWKKTTTQTLKAYQQLLKSLK